MSLSGNFFMEVTSTGRLSLIFFPLFFILFFFFRSLIVIYDWRCWRGIPGVSFPGPSPSTTEHLLVRHRASLHQSPCVSLFATSPVSVHHRASLPLPQRASLSATVCLFFRHDASPCFLPRVCLTTTVRHSLYISAFPSVLQLRTVVYLHTPEATTTQPPQVPPKKPSRTPLSRDMEAIDRFHLGGWDSY